MFIRDHINFPLESIENKGSMIFTISSEALSRAISLMPEHTAIGVMRNALIDVFVTPPTQIRLDFLHFGSDYSIMHTMLMGDEAATYDSYYSFNRKDYQAQYNSKLDILLSTTVIYTVDIRDKFNTSIGGFKPFSANSNLGKSKYTFTSTGSRNSYITLKITQNDGSVFGKYLISNKYLFFTSESFLFSSGFRIGINQSPIFKSRTKFSIVDVLKTD
tara:strand:+ start:1219 stop:1869 length:651 start_codon:yes stop_codon:yes gene_type:complete